MKRRNTIITKNVTVAANAAKGVYESEIKASKEFGKVIGMAAVSVGEHTNLGVGLFNDRNEELVAIAHTKFFDPSNEQRLFPIDIEIDDDPFTIKVQLYAVQNLEAQVQVILELSNEQ